MLLTKICLYAKRRFGPTSKCCALILAPLSCWYTINCFFGNVNCLFGSDVKDLNRKDIFDFCQNNLGKKNLTEMANNRVITYFDKKYATISRKSQNIETKIETCNMVSGSFIIETYFVVLGQT